MSEFKYICGEFPSDTGKLEGAVVFPKWMIHSEVARNLRGKINGAGFFYIVDGEVSVFGRSESLNIDSRPEDSKHLARVLGLQAA